MSAYDFPEGMQQTAAESFQFALRLPSQTLQLGYAEQWAAVLALTLASCVSGLNKFLDFSEFQFLHLFKHYTCFRGLS